MKINDKILSIPPYISTSWTFISAIHMKGSLLAVTLIDGDTIHIPGLKQEVIEAVFRFHADFLEKNLMHDDPLLHAPSTNITGIAGFNITPDASLRLAFGSLDGINNMMQHNPEQANAPELPQELLQKITAITKILAPDEAILPKAEPHCNCFHCQVARALSTIELRPAAIEEKETVKDDELQFQQWEIRPMNDKLFTVINKLDQQEKYNVFLGEPVGCTCGKQGCEHMLAVLKS